MPNQYTGPTNPLTRFNALTRYNPYTGCWLWAGAKSPLGYGRFRFWGKTVQSHRFIYTVRKGPIGPRPLDHLCRRPACVNPNHLEAVSDRENVLRGIIPDMLRERAAAITHCPQGHEYSKENTYRDKKNIRHCKECNRRYSRDYQRRRRMQLSVS